MPTVHGEPGRGGLAQTRGQDQSGLKDSSAAAFADWQTEFLDPHYTFFLIQAPGDFKCWFFPFLAKWSKCQHQQALRCWGGRPYRWPCTVVTAVILGDGVDGGFLRLKRHPIPL